MKKFSILSFCFLFFFVYGIVNAQVNVPQTLIGNWINEQDNSWEYGFFEDFAIYESDFWEYEAIEEGKKRIEIRLKKGNEQVTLKVKPSKSGQFAISRNNEKFRKFKPNVPGFFPYPTPDTTSFKNSGFQQDTVTIIGYYRNLDKYHEKSGKGHTNPFKVSVPNFIQDKSVEYFADIDSLGRFEIKFPVLNTQEIYIDWGRLTQQNVVEPGETLFLFAYMADFIPTENEMKMGREDRRDALRERPKRILYMGEEARLHNELAHFKRSSGYFDIREAWSKIASDRDYQEAANNDYKIRLLHLDSFIESQPAISERFKEYAYAQAKYKLASYLMQYRFAKYEKQKKAFDEGYMDHVNAIVDLDDPKLFTLFREYSTFMRDYIGYYEFLNTYKLDEKTGKWMSTSTVSVRTDEVLDGLRREGFFNEQEEKILDNYKEFQADVDSLLFPGIDSIAAARIIKPYKNKIEEINALVERPKVKEEISQRTSSLLSKKRLEAKLHPIDSLIENNVLKELITVRKFYASIDNNRKPLYPAELALLDEKVLNPVIKNYVLDAHQHYMDVENKDISYQASLKNTDHLREAKDADSLFSELITPYKGKVIYLDFWGTWCGPCRQQMPFANAIKKEFKGKEVVFMYLANRSPEKSWMNVIKEMDLSGENVVHYRLPDPQQGMIERKLSVQSFPTYMLIDKTGIIVNDQAPRPELKNELVSALNKLLAE